MHLTAASFLHAAWMLMLMAVALAWWWWQRDTDRIEIRKEASRWNAQVIGIQCLPCHCINENETCYEVTLQLASGERVSAICRCSRYNHLVWEGPPWWAHGQQPEDSPDRMLQPSFHDTLSAHAPSPAGRSPTSH